MKERPILFSAPMVRAILDGTKTQTRRAVKRKALEMLCPPIEFSPDFVAHPENYLCPYGEAGDRLWVRETWAQDDEDGQLMYRADLGRDMCADAWEQGRIEGVPRYRWRPSIHMPRTASRITLDISEVRVEHLQDISATDALAEGIVRLPDGGYGLPGGSHYHHTDPRISYWSLWDAINGLGATEANPWVWALTLKTIHTTRPAICGNSADEGGAA